MIGKIVEHILEEGFDVGIYQRSDTIKSERPAVICLSISKLVEKDVVQIDWTLLVEEVSILPEYLLLDQCERRLQQLRDAIVQKEKIDVQAKETQKKL